MERNHDNITFINDIIQSQEPFLRLSDITADTNENMLTPPWPHAHPEDIHINNIIGVQYQPDNEEEVNNSIGGPTSYVNLAGTTVYIPCQKSGHFNGSLEHCNFCKLEAGELDHLRPYQRDRLTIEAPHNPPDWFRTRKFSPEMCEHHPDLADDCLVLYLLLLSIRCKEDMVLPTLQLTPLPLPSLLPHSLSQITKCLID
jgi:hypothetical protein